MEAKYIDHMGDDLRVVNAARVSFAKESKEFKGVYEHLAELGTDNYITIPVVKDKDAKLIKYLAEHGHWTPFAHPQITIREKVPIFVARQRFKHMVGFIYNEVSRRYVDDPPEFYIPDKWRSRPEGSVKQGSGTEVVELPFDLVSYDPELELADFYELCLNIYNNLLENNVAPEQARMVLPQSMYTEYYVTGSLAAWARAYKQRIDLHAQMEIQDLAVEWNKIIEPLFPVSWKALTQNVKSET